MLFFQYAVKMGLIVIFSVRLIESAQNLFGEGSLHSWFQGIYSLVFLFFAVAYKPSNEANLSLQAILVTLIHLATPVFFQSQFVPGNEWLIPLASALVIIGFGVSAVSILDLSLSFDVLPAKRNVVSTGMYKFVRHPIYLGYLIACFGMFARSPSFFNAFVFFIFVYLTVLRIKLEETELEKSDDYARLQLQTRYQLVPWVF